MELYFGCYTRWVCSRNSVKYFSIKYIHQWKGGWSNLPFPISTDFTLNKRRITTHHNVNSERLIHIWRQRTLRTQRRLPLEQPHIGHSNILTRRFAVCFGSAHRTQNKVCQVANKHHMTIKCNIESAFCNFIFSSVSSVAPETLSAIPSGNMPLSAAKKGCPWQRRVVSSPMADNRAADAFIKALLIATAPGAIQRDSIQFHSSLQIGFAGNEVQATAMWSKAVVCTCFCFLHTRNCERWCLQSLQAVDLNASMRLCIHEINSKSQEVVEVGRRTLAAGWGCEFC